MDDLLIIWSNEIEETKLKTNFKNEFDMWDLRDLTYFLSLEFVNTKYDFFFAPEEISRRKVEVQDEQLQPYNYSHENKNEIEKKNSNDELVDGTLCKHINDSPRYLCNTRPDIWHNVDLVSMYMEEQRSHHLLAAKRILKYIKDTVNYGILKSN